MRTAGQNDPITNRQGGPVLPPGILKGGPGRDAATLPGGSEIHGGDDVTTGGAPVVIRALPAPLTGASTAVEAEIDIINAARLSTGNFIPI